MLYVIYTVTVIGDEPLCSLTDSAGERELSRSYDGPLEFGSESGRMISCSAVPYVAGVLRLCRTSSIRTTTMIETQRTPPSVPPIIPMYTEADEASGSDVDEGLSMAKVACPVGHLVMALSNGNCFVGDAVGSVTRSSYETVSEPRAFLSLQ